jgi:hypothetical protein
MRLMAIALASLSGGSVYACCGFACDGAATATGAGVDCVAAFCAVSACGKLQASTAPNQTNGRKRRLNLNPILLLARNSARIEQTDVFAKISNSHAQPF